MQIIAYLVVRSITALNEALLLFNQPPMPEEVEIALNDLALLLVTVYQLPIDLGFTY